MTPKVVGMGMLLAVCLIATYVDKAHSVQSDDSSRAISTTASTSDESVANNTDDESPDVNEAEEETVTKQSVAQTQQAAAPQTATSPTTATTPTPVAASSGYKDGTYTKTAGYSVPHDQNSITVTIVVKNGAITSVSDNHDYGSNESSRYISRFDSAISSKVVGQKLGSVSLSRVGGASLTTNGFLSALSAITKDAKA